ncbi:DinB family protein [Heyndrickxia ginsengihumi]|uniref:DinB family protein n=1 Tax=Heyndrickxia ginsengihumi TaxID=363870 RepID=UPI00203A55FC|nr:DinB family protein [Heyndrickxia ginsengihumi]MCM3024666.1 hypothetical protein [Heyndrickxia ginsengihumi]
MNELAKQLVRYHIWANQQLISHLKTLPSELFHTKVESVFPTLAETFGHIISVDYVWLSRINKEKPSKIQKWTFQTVAAYKNTKGELFTQTLFELIQHIVNHGTYHRGNLAAMIRQLGYQGTSTDYITFLRIQNS